MTLFHQSDSDTSESSESDDELLSAVLEQSSTVHLSDEPRRITRIRGNLIDALLAAFTILRAVRPGCGPYAPMTTRNQAGMAVASRRSNANLEDPWKVLESSVVCMSKNLKDKRIREIPEIVAGLGVFDHLCRQLLEPLSTDRRYVKETLNKSEAKSVRPFIKQLDMLRQSNLLWSVPLAPQSTLAIQQTPPAVLCRTVMMALSPSSGRHTHYWNLSALPFVQPDVVLDSLDLLRLFEAFGVDPSSLDRLAVGHNRITDFPYRFAEVFTEIEQLDVSGNRSMKALPMSVTRLGRLKKIYTKSTRIECFVSAQGLVVGRDHEPRPVGAHRKSGPVSLVSACLAILIRHDDDMEYTVEPNAMRYDAVSPFICGPFRSITIDIPPKHRLCYRRMSGLSPVLGEKLDLGYVCERCRSVSYPLSPWWLPGRSYHAWPVKDNESEASSHGKVIWVTVVANLCMVCRNLLRTVGPLEDS